MHPASIKTIHRDAYPSISPLRAELSQAGRTVLVTGGATGIGYAIAQAFCQAAAARVVLVGRREAVLDAAVSKLTEYGKQRGAGTRFCSYACDVADLESTKQLWSRLGADGIVVDVLVLNAASISETQTILQRGLESLWNDYLINVRALMDLTERFYKQEKRENHETKFVVNVSTAAIHLWDDAAPDRPAYGLTKNSGTLLLQQIAKDVTPDSMQIVSYHPGAVFTDSARSAGYKADTLLWDEPDLAGHFAVWAASQEAAFLHGRFVWAAWDVEELRSPELAARFKNEPGFLKIGVLGL